MPLDPKDEDPYLYKYQSFLTGGINRDFKLFATLENINDQKGWGGGEEWVADGYVLEND